VGTRERDGLPTRSVGTSEVPAGGVSLRSVGTRDDDPEPRIEVRIGRIELRAGPTPTPKAPPASKRRGFDDYSLARRYLRPRWY
jgi:hypothetical protein